MKSRNYGLFVWFLLLIANCDLCAQSWKKIATFDGYVSLVKFLDVNTGFVGLGLSPGSPLQGQAPIELYKTTDAGATWNKVSIPNGYSGEIGDIVMIDESNGWLAMTAWGGSGNKALWKTTDGGLTWNETSLVGSGTSIRVAPNAMIVTDLFNAGHLSTDGGKTFSNSLPSSTNCADFVDSLHGAISDFRGQHWLYTSDGGLTWQNSAMNVESWSVTGIYGTSDFYAAPEGPTDGSLYTPQIYRSTDFGASWKSIYKFPFLVTGHIGGIGEQVLFCQVSIDGIAQDTARTGGFYSSSDKGLTWNSIGGPTGNHDTRFSVIQGCNAFNLFGFDDESPGSLYEYSSGSAEPSQSVKLHSESASAYFGQIDSLTLGVDIGSLINLDSLWPYITDIQASYVWDSSIVSYASFLPPTGWLLSTITHQGTSATFDIQDASAITTQPLHIGTGLFRPRSTQIGSTWVKLSQLAIVAGNETISFCVSDNEDSHWDVKSLGILDAVAKNKADALDITIYPNPTSDKIFVENTSTLPASITIYDPIGRSVGTSIVQAFSTISLNVNLLPKGWYQLVCKMGYQVLLRRFNKIY